MENIKVNQLASIPPYYRKWMVDNITNIKIKNEIERLVKFIMYKSFYITKLDLKLNKEMNREINQTLIYI